MYPVAHTVHPADTVQVAQLYAAAVEQAPVFVKHPDVHVVQAVPAALQVVQVYVVFEALHGVNDNFRL